MVRRMIKTLEFMRPILMATFLAVQGITVIWIFDRLAEFIDLLNRLHINRLSTDSHHFLAIILTVGSMIYIFDWEIGILRKYIQNPSLHQYLWLLGLKARTPLIFFPNKPWRSTATVHDASLIDFATTSNGIVRSVGFTIWLITLLFGLTVVLCILQCLSVDGPSYQLMGGILYLILLAPFQKLGQRMANNYKVRLDFTNGEAKISNSFLPHSRVIKTTEVTTFAKVSETMVKLTDLTFSVYQLQGRFCSFPVAYSLSMNDDPHLTEALEL
jgi:hypothetical protein